MKLLSHRHQSIAFEEIAARISRFLNNRRKKMTLVCFSPYHGDSSRLEMSARRMASAMATSPRAGKGMKMVIEDFGK